MVYLDGKVRALQHGLALGLGRHDEKQKGYSPSRRQTSRPRRTVVSDVRLLRNSLQKLYHLWQTARVPNLYNLRSGRVETLCLDGSWPDNPAQPLGVITTNGISLLWQPSSHTYLPLLIY